LIAAAGPLPGCVVTLDALHAVRKTFELTVVGSQADFLVCVKGNAEDLRRKVEQILRRKANDIQRARTVDKDHGRIESRDLEMVSTTPVETGWPHTHVVCRVTRQREIRRRGQTVGSSCEQVYYVGSFALATYTPEQVLALSRGHWSIENGLHHRKDRSLDEDRNRASGRGSGRLMCCLRSFTALLLGRARESLSVVQRRLSGKLHLLLGLFSCHSVQQWERRYKPYRVI
jgi:predicted transposase YbfD/YdcC